MVRNLYLSGEEGVGIDFRKLSRGLNARCKEYKFEAVPKPLLSEEAYVKCSTGKLLKEDAHRHLQGPAEVEGDGNALLCYCTDVFFSDNYFYHGDNRKVVFSFADWDRLTSLPKNNGLVHFIVQSLAQEILPSSYRHVSKAERECIFDFHQDKSNVDICMRTAMICPACLKRLKKEKKSDDARLRDLKAILHDLGEASKWGNDIVSFWQYKGLFGKRVFVCYARKDSKWLEIVGPHLSPLEREGKIRIFTDTRVDCGEDWEKEILGGIEKAEIAILLVGPNFLASPYIMEKEWPTIKERRQQGEIKVFPVCIGNCNIPEDLQKIQFLNDPKKPLGGLSKEGKDRHFAELARQIEKIAWEKE